MSSSQTGPFLKKNDLCGPDQTMKKEMDIWLRLKVCEKLRFRLTTGEGDQIKCIVILRAPKKRELLTGMVAKCL